jgi:hypothetical protein
MLLILPNQTLQLIKRPQIDVRLLVVTAKLDEVTCVISSLHNLFLQKHLFCLSLSVENVFVVTHLWFDFRVGFGFEE